MSAPVAMTADDHFARACAERDRADEWAKRADDLSKKLEAAEAARAEATRRLAVVAIELDAQRKRADDAELLCRRFGWTFDRPLCSVCLRIVGDYTPGCRGCDDDVPRADRAALENPK